MVLTRRAKVQLMNVNDEDSEDNGLADPGYDVPDFELLYGRTSESNLSPRTAAFLWEAADSLDTLLHDLPVDSRRDELSRRLPIVAAPYVDDRFVEAFRSRVGIVVERLAEGTVGKLIATCTADEIAIWLISWDAGARHDCGDDPEWVEARLPPRPGRDADFDRAVDILTEDDDVLMLFNPEIDGVEDLEWSEDAFDPPVNLHPRDWFKPFRG